MGNSYKFPEDKYLLIGKVNKAHGMRGEVKVYLFSGEPNHFAQYDEVVLVDEKGSLSPSLRVEKSRPQGKLAITLFSTITDRNRSEYIEGMGVLVARDSLPEIADDEYYWHQIIGQKVLDINGNEIGEVRELFSNGAQDVMSITNSYGEDFLIPVTAEIVVEIDDNSIVIDPPEGLLDMNEIE